MNSLMFWFNFNERKNNNKGKHTSRKIRYEWSLLLILLSIIFILSLLSSPNQLKSSLFQNTAFWFVASGILTSIYFARFNDWIYQYPKLELNNGDDEYRNEYAKLNTVWVHCVSGFVAGVAAYLLINNFPGINSLSAKHLILFLIAFGGYTGLLPRWLWFFASRGGPGEPKS